MVFRVSNAFGFPGTEPPIIIILNGWPGMQD